jgi:serine/threonine-protein kinase PknK
MRRWLLLAVFALGCGDDDATRDGGGEDAALIEDARPVDAPAADRAMPECAPCPAESPWACEQCLPSPLQEVTAAVLDGTIVIAGGFESTVRIVPTVRQLDPAIGEWRELPPLPEARHHLSLVAMGGDLYAIGGMASLAFEPLTDCWVLRSGASEWTTIAPLPTARAAAGAAAIDGAIVVAGGQGPGAGADAQLAAAAPALVYDPGADEWREGASIPTPREHVASFAHDGELWVLGGRSISLEPTMAVVERYDPVTDEWRSGPAMPSPHGGFAAAVLDGVAYVGGGEERERALRTFEALDLAASEWTTAAPIPTARHGHAMAALDGRIWVIGGANEPVFAAVPTVESFTP